MPTMRSSSTRPNLQPLRIPELAYSPPATGYASPAESDIQTPFFDHSDAYIPFNPHNQQELSLEPHIPPYTRKNSAMLLHLPPPSAIFLQLAKNRTTIRYPARVPLLRLPLSQRGRVFSTSTFSCGHNSEPHPEKPRLSHGPLRASSDRHACSAPSTPPLNLRASVHSPRFPPDHELNPYFDELGSGGYGTEVAVKFILKEKVPDHSWMEDKVGSREARSLPTEVMLLRVIEHENIVKCLGLYEDPLYYYLIQELHGTPWHKTIRNPPSPPISTLSSLPSLSPSVSTDFITPLNRLPAHVPRSADELQAKRRLEAPRPSLPLPVAPRPEYSRRPSHDLFECIEQSEHKRLSEDQARYVLGQVVDAVYYLDCHGVTHRDIKDENLVIDEHLKRARPYHTLFYGTTAYASSEILLKKPYQAPPADFLLTGSSPFPTVKDAIAGKIVLTDCPRI
ncbi:kinase-like domain-containing protein, partial [Mycena galopus ATCC 62051]